MKTLLRPILASATALALLAAPYAFADDAYWSFNGLGNFTNTANWSVNADGTGGNPAAVPGAGNIAYFNSSNNNNNITANLTAALSLNGAGGLVINNTGTTTINSDGAGNRAITLGTAGLTINSGAGAVTFGTTIATQRVTFVLNGSQTWTNNSSNALLLNTSSSISTGGTGANNGAALTVAGTGDISLGGIISQNGTITKNGSGQLTLSSANTFNGTVTLNAGKLVLGSNGALGNQTLTINDGTTIDVTNARTNTKNNSMNWNGNFTFGGCNTWDSGTGAVTMNASRTVTVSGSTMTVGGDISGVGFGLTKTGAGTLTLNGTNSYSGGTTVNGGTLWAKKAAALSGYAADTISVNNAGSVLALSANATTGEWTSAQIDGLLANTNLTFGAGTSLGIETTENLTYNTNITKANMGLVKSGSQRLYLGGDNTYSGNTLVTGGTILAAHDNAYGTGTVTFNGGGWGGEGNHTIANDIIYAANTNSNNLAAANVTNFAGQTSGTGNLSVNGFENGIVRFSGDNSGWSGNWKFSGPITLQLNHIDAMGSGTTITFNTNATANAARGILESQVALTGVSAITQNIDLGGTLAFTGNSTIRTTAAMEVTGDITGGANATFVKDGADILTLSGTNTYLGNTSVNAGTLIINGDASGATGAVTVASGATLGGSGTIGGATTIQAGAFLSPGNSPGVLIFNDALTLAGTTTMQIDGTGRGTTYDGIDTGTGLLTYGGALTLDFTAATADGNNYDLFNIGLGGSTGSFASVNLMGTYTDTLVNNLGVWSVTNSGFIFTFTEATGNLGIAAIPEPTTWLLAAFGLTTVVVFRRRRRD